MEINQQTISQLKQAGYSEKEISEAVQEIEHEERLKQQYSSMSQNSQLPNPIGMQQSAFSFNPNDNLVKWQLELNEILERSEHLLREDILTYDKGHIVWKDNPSKVKIFSDYGVKEIMRVLSAYVNRNTILADYTSEEINDKVYDFGVEISDLIYEKYEDFGLDTPEKRKNYSIIVRMLVDIVHSSYTRAKDGAEKSSLREARQLQQVENVGLGSSGGGNMPSESQQRGMLNPLRYLVGRYYKG